MKTPVPASCASLDLKKTRRALIRAHGNVYAAAKSLKVPIHDLRLMTRAIPGLLEAALEAEEQALDQAEEELRQALRGADPAKSREAARTWLKNSPAARRRGF